MSACLDEGQRLLFRICNSTTHISIISYLSNRYQYVQFENCKSDLLEVKTGIPQGSILGPLFFSVLINDIVT